LKYDLATDPSNTYEFNKAQHEQNSLTKTPNKAREILFLETISNTNTNSYIRKYVDLMKRSRLTKGQYSSMS